MQAQTAGTQATGQKATVETAQPAITTQRFGDWSLRCTNTKMADGRHTAQCEVVQVAEVKQGTEAVNILTLALSKPPLPAKATDKAVGSLMLTAVVPLNIFLPSGLGIDIDGTAAIDASYRNCNQAGCWVELPLDSNRVAALRKGASGGARLRLMNGQGVNVKFSLKGLTAALAELETVSAADKAIAE